MIMFAVPTPDADEHKGAVEQESRNQESNTSLRGQMQHRNPSPLANSLDTDFPEPGMSPEHTGQHESPGHDAADPNSIPDAEHQDPDPGQRLKRSPGDTKDDPQAA